MGEKRYDLDWHMSTDARTVGGVVLSDEMIDVARTSDKVMLPGATIAMTCLLHRERVTDIECDLTVTPTSLGEAVLVSMILPREVFIHDSEYPINVRGIVNDSVVLAFPHLTLEGMETRTGGATWSTVWISHPDRNGAHLAYRKM